MSIQLASDAQVAIKRQVAKGTPASGAGATGYNLLASQGLKLAKGSIPNGVIRRDRQSKRNRHGSRSGQAVYKLPMSQGTLDPLLEAGLGGTFVATFDITNSSVLGGSAAATSITTTTSTAVVAAGSLLTQGLRKGMRVKFTGLTDAANNGKWLRVLDVAALTVTFPTGSLVLNATPDTSFTMTVAKSLTNPQTFTERYHTVEDFYQGITKGLLGTDMKVCKIEFNAQPEQLLEITFTLMGLDVQPQTSNILTSPTYSTTVELVMMDGMIRIGGVDYNVLTGFQFTWDMGGTVPKTLSTTGPDVILDQGKLSGSFTALRQDLVFFTAFSNETVFDIHLDVMEPDLTDPKDFTSFYFGNLTLSDDTTGIQQTGPMSESVPWSAGIDDVGGASALTTMLISSSAA
jgi:tail tube protein